MIVNLSSVLRKSKIVDWKFKIINSVEYLVQGYALGAIAEVADILGTQFLIDEDHASKAEIDIHELNIYDLPIIM